MAAYRIVQEALTNVRKHAAATTVRVALERGEHLVVRVSDDGVGVPQERRSGVGLASMRERAAELGGTCLITSPPGGGTTVEAVLPLVLEGDRPPTPSSPPDAIHPLQPVSSQGMNDGECCRMSLVQVAVPLHLRC
nr:hypothetical protein GCM10020093_111370 [Planobispora longispora]